MRLLIDSQGAPAVVPTLVQPCGDSDVVVRVKTCGICGSDLSIWRARRPLTDAWGHEVHGTVTMIGAEVDSAWLGKEVVTRTSTPCGRCRYCQAGRFGRCTGWQRLHFNGFSSHVTLPVSLLERAQDGSGDTTLLVEPVYVAMDLLAKAELAPGDTVLLVGCGPIALLVLHLLKQENRTPVWLMHRPGSKRRHQIAEEWGAHLLCMDSLDDSSSKLVFDSAIVTAPYRVIPDIQRHVGHGGRIVYNGISDHASVNMDFLDLHTRRIALTPSFPHPQLSFRSAADYVARHSMSLSTLISHRVPLSASSAVFDLFIEERDRVVKVAIDCLH